MQMPVSAFTLNSHVLLIWQSALIINSITVWYAVLSKAEYTQVSSTIQGHQIYKLFQESYLLLSLQVVGDPFKFSVVLLAVAPM
jgi:hypothetical protein